MRIVQKLVGQPDSLFSGGPFKAMIQVRYKKPANTAQTRLESCTRDIKLDLVASRRCVALTSSTSMISQPRGNETYTSRYSSSPAGRNTPASTPSSPASTPSSPVSTPSPPVTSCGSTRTFSRF